MYFAGVKYAKLIPVGRKAALSPSGQVKIHLNEGVNDLVFEPGSGLNWSLGKNVALCAAVSTPIRENTNLFRRTLLKSGVGVNILFEK